MTLQIICIILSVLTMAFYLWGKLPMGLVAILSMLLFIFTGCIDVSTALSGISNSATVMMLAIFILATGFNRTQFSKKCANAVAGWAKGSLTKVMIGYTLLAILLTQLTQAPMIVMTVICPSLSATCKELNVSPSKAVFGIGVAAIACCCALPIAAGSTVFAEFNGYLEASNYTEYQVSLMDPFIARFPIVIASFVYCAFFSAKLAPDKPAIEITSFSGAAAEQKPLPPLQEKLGYAVFLLTSIALFFQPQLGIPMPIICITGAALMVLTGVISEKEAFAAVPWGLLCLYVGALSMAAALSNTGVADLIGQALGNLALSVNSQYLIGVVFFIIPFLLTQIMMNISVMYVFYPIAIVTCKAVGANPIGILLLVQQASLTAFMTPMANGTVPVMMAEGGYDVRSLIKQGWLPSIIFTVVSVAWIMTIFPMF